ncbi:hypothetical protein BU23DRAFT_239135 [Bimuria novae-zelandiae CBS 107.79]|uniref:Uncharacterized protein n=1 Tax=Bimuria novae-zelandiae CBS 107.79 TaxID=1447943 RepID=A0A6A5UYD2_9PLEO|nr:hypothetical protein BU23DRAFT_239135 [Bimuria novae-zelandiae CBS 107.79]
MRIVPLLPLNRLDITSLYHYTLALAIRIVQIYMHACTLTRDVHNWPQPECARWSRNSLSPMPIAQYKRPACRFLRKLTRCATLQLPSVTLVYLVYSNPIQTDILPCAWRTHTT